MANPASFKASPLQALIIWRLFFASDTVAWHKANEIKPALKKKDRDALINAGIIEVEKRSNRAMYIKLADGAWDWAVDNMDAEISKRTFAGCLVVQDMLACLGKHMSKGTFSFAEFMHALPDEREGEESVNEWSNENVVSTGGLYEQVRKAYFACSSGRANVRVRLADLRDRLPEINREILDRQLLDMQERQELVLYPIDDGLDIAERDRAAEISIAGYKRHIMYMEG